MRTLHVRQGMWTHYQCYETLLIIISCGSSESPTCKWTNHADNRKSDFKCNCSQHSDLRFRCQNQTKKKSQTVDLEIHYLLVPSVKAHHCHVHEGPPWLRKSRVRTGSLSHTWRFNGMECIATGGWWCNIVSALSQDATPVLRDKLATKLTLLARFPNCHTLF